MGNVSILFSYDAKNISQGCVCCEDSLEDGNTRRRRDEDLIEEE